MPNAFLDDLFGDQNGFVYSPIKLPDVPKPKNWVQHFFEYPRHRERLERHLDNFTERDVYISPVLFTESRISPETFRGTRFLWTEFDGSLPTEFVDPSLRVASSLEGHEHWYWRLDEFVTDKVLIEDYNRRIVYHYGGDLSVHDYQNVLRPPDTWNHKRNKPVSLISRNNRIYKLDDFSKIPIPESRARAEFALEGLPPREEVLAKYKWKADTLDLLFKPYSEELDRSRALMRLAHDAIEAGCSNEETYVLIEERDRVWDKYLGRSDRDKQLKACISHARAKKVLTAELHQEAATEVYRFNDFMSTKLKMKWAIEGLLPVAGSMVILGRPGIGKSTFALRMAMSLALGHSHFLQWPVANRQRTLFISLEMQHAELKQFFDDMNLAEEVRAELQEWFYIWPIGFAYPFDVPDQQPELLKFIDQHKIELIVIDSLGLSMYGSVKNDDDVKRLNSFLNEDVRHARKCGYVFIHHDRKQGITDLKEVDLDDVFGSRYITANAQTVMLLHQIKGSPKVRVSQLKTRMTLGERFFDIVRTPDRGFKLDGIDPLPATATVSESKSVNRETESIQKADDGSFGKLFGVLVSGS